MSGIRRISDLGTRGFATLADGSVTTSKIANNAVIQLDLSTDVFLSGFRNFIINGSFDIWQRATSATTTGTDTYASADRWRIRTADGAGSVLSSRQSAGLAGFQYCMRFQRVSGNTNTAPLQLIQTLETSESIKLTGGPVTVSFWARSGPNYSPTSALLGVNLTNGTGTDQYWLSFTGSTALINQTATLTSSWQRFIFTVTPPSNATQFFLQFEMVPTGTAGANDYFEITGVQLEKSPQVTPFEQRPISTELILCQRYYETSNGVCQVTAGATGFGGNTYWGWIGYKVEKRIALNLVTNSTSNGVRVFATDGGADYITMWKAATQYYSAAENFEIWTTQGFGINTTSGQTDAGLGRFYWNANAEL